MHTTQTFSRSTLDELVARIDDVSTLPQVALRIMEVANDPDSGAIDLKGVMEGDAALSARVLRCVNSSAYALRTKVTNLQHAIAFLGLKQIRNLALTASVAKLFHNDVAIGTYRRAALWRHMVSVGICARMIALRHKLANFEDVFLSGLLHDVGIIFEDQHCHARFCTVVQSLDKDRTLIEVEHDHLGFDHATLAARVAEAWGFPPAVKAAVRCHHNSPACRSEDIDAVRCVEVANLICSLKGITSVGVQLVKLSRPALEGLSLGKNELLVLAEDLDRELVVNSQLFET